MKFKIKPFSDDIYSMYKNHSHFHQGDAGLDLFITKDQVIDPGSTAKIHLGISCENMEMKPYLLMARSSISKTPLRLSNAVGLIDAGYRGEIMAAVDNIKDSSYRLEKGQRLFQLVSMNGESIHFDLVDTLSDTSRGEDGFGSTGK
jgi:dUTP pyrophosphatase|tara:strand:- start:333 stop:770 length:438 start_codon:yes stop_codon:yes gene_type:complete